jgi:hypothetical protein
VRRVRVTFIAGQVPRIYAAAIDQKDGRLPERSSLRRGRASLTLRLRSPRVVGHDIDGLDCAVVGEGRRSWSSVAVKSQRGDPIS